MENDAEAVSPVKLASGRKTLNLSATVCLICGKYAKKGTLRNPTQQGLTSFINALIARGECQNFRVDDFTEFIDVNSKTWTKQAADVHWHPDCYKSYTNKRNFPKTLEKDDNDQITSPTTRSQNTSLNFKTQCFFCGFSKKNNVKKLCKVEYDDTLKKIEARCNAKNDNELRRRNGGDFSKLPADEARYHPICYKSYIKPLETPENIESPHDTAFSKLFEYMDPIFDSGRALTMTFLPNHFQDLLRDDGYQDFSCYRTQKLKSKLINHYRDKITITDEQNQQQSVFSSAISIADAVNCAMKYKQLTKNLEITSTPKSEGRNDRVIERVGQLVKQDIADIRGISIHPLDPEDINENKVDEIVPESLLHLLQSICGDSRKVKSIAQDIVSAASNGKKRMPKHVGLGISLKNSLRSKEYITKLNNLGHSISYDDVQRIETTWASSIIDSGEGYATLPSNTVRDVFSQAASDNGDFC